MRAERMLVVLGCRPGARGQVEGPAKRRVLAAAGAYALSPAGTLVVCAGGRAWEGVVEADAFAGALASLGVPPAALVRERCSMTTAENARYVAALWSRRRAITGVAAEVHLVTCEWHLPRAEGHFQAAGLRVTRVPAPSPPGPLPKALHAAWFALRERGAALLDGTRAGSPRMGEA